MVQGSARARARATARVPLPGRVPGRVGCLWINLCVETETREAERACACHACPLVTPLHDLVEHRVDEPPEREHAQCLVLPSEMIGTSSDHRAPGESAGSGVAGVASYVCIVSQLL